MAKADRRGAVRVCGMDRGCPSSARPVIALREDKKAQDVWRESNEARPPRLCLLAIDSGSTKPRSVQSLPRPPLDPPTFK